MAVNAKARPVEKSTTYTIGDGTSSITLKVVPESFSFTPMANVYSEVPDHNGGLIAVLDEGQQREAWAGSFSCKLIDWGTNADGDESVRRVLDALRNNTVASIDTGTPWVSTNPLTGGGVDMLDFTVSVVCSDGSSGTETHTASLGAVWVTDYSISVESGGYVLSANIRGCEKPTYAVS